MKFVFLSYLNRSGSTFLVNQLSKLPGVLVCPEADILFERLLCGPKEMLFPAESGKIVASLRNDPKFSVWKLDLSPFERYSGTRFDLFQQILISFANTHTQKAEIVLFKHNYLYSLYSQIDNKDDVVFLSLLRHPAAIYASQLKTISPATGKAMSRNPLALIDQWNSLLHFVTSPQTQECHALILYEDLIEKPVETMNRICSLFSVRAHWEDLLQQPGKVADWLPYEYRAMHLNIDKEPIVEKIDRWKQELSTMMKNLLAKYMNKNPFYTFTSTKQNSTLLLCYALFYRFDRKRMWWKDKLKHLFQHGV